MLLRISAGIALLCALAPSAPCLQAQSLSKAEDLYIHTDFERSLALLDKRASNSAEAFLIGRDYYMLGEFKKATEYLQKAASLTPPAASTWIGWAAHSGSERIPPQTR